MSELSRRKTRYQAAIVRDGHILLIQQLVHATGIGHWLLPGGGREDGEPEGECAVREVREETGLEVAVQRLLFAAATPGDRVYDERKTYLCRVIAGEASPGAEPEPEHSAVYAIAETSWVELNNPSAWCDTISADGKTYPELLRIRELLEFA